MKNQQGFTLIEVMVAILLMAVVSLIAWRGLDSVTRADSHLQASSEQSDSLLRALNQLQRDVEMRAGIELTEPKKVGVDDEPPTAPLPSPCVAVTVRGFGSTSFVRRLISRGLCSGFAGGLRAARCIGRWLRRGVAIRCRRLGMGLRC